MAALMLNPTSTAQWHALVTEAEAAAQRDIDEELESYLVFLLMRFTHRPALVGQVMAQEFLHGLMEMGRVRQDKLRDVGDTCLLFSGLFPRLAQRRRVRVSYFVDIGRSAYHTLSHCMTHASAEMYDQLSRDFVSLMDILQAMRELGQSDPILDALPAFELWSDTGSTQAYRSLRSLADGLPVPVAVAVPGKKETH